MTTIYFHGSRADARAIVRRAVAALSGHGGDVHGMAEGIQLGIGTEAMSLIRTAFVAKSRGGVDEAGETWDKLRPEYIAYTRRQPRVPRPRGGNRGGVFRWSLTASQDKRWKAIFAGYMKEAAGRTPYTGTEEQIQERKREDAHKAASLAWTILKAEGATTLLEEYGNAQVEIGRDTDVMFNSLSPGVLRTEPGAVIVGTNVPYAAHFHKKRRLWPDPRRWPGRWWNQICGRASDGFRKMLITMLQGW